ncbi:MAG: type II toxin-antitoxin system HipA family toxin [Angustibacter sp.]
MAEPTEAYVWAWLPEQVEPIVVGRLRAAGVLITFTYGRSYLARPQAAPLFLPELPLIRGPIRPARGLSVAGCIRDGGPDAWGQRVILARRLGNLDRAANTGTLGLLTYLLESGSDRIGALDFQDNATRYVPRTADADLEELQTATDRLQAGEPLSPPLADALLRGTSIGGARPKALLRDDRSGRQLIAKFEVASDPYPVVRAEAVAMDLAQRVGLDVARTELVRTRGRSVLLVERFDRVPAPHGVGPQRRMIVSALTLFGLDEMTGRYATYHGLADLVRARFTQPSRTLREVFSRIVFNICVSNTDDHARNHAAFYRPNATGGDLTLTPAYDICPQPRSGDTAQQALAIDRDGRRTSRVELCVQAAHLYHLTAKQARDIIDHQVSTIEAEWRDAADAAQLTALERTLLWRRQILNPAIHYSL